MNSLDPELLGQVFENLLASYNPETGETARKATGSYYTPREIVDYMVYESLGAFFSGPAVEKNFNNTNELYNLCHSHESGNPCLSNNIDSRLRRNDVNLNVPQNSLYSIRRHI